MKNPITELREQHGMNRREFAAKAEIPYQTATTLELGMVRRMSVKTDDRIATAFKLIPGAAMESFQAWTDSRQK